MIVACHQPNYLPWLGYFYKLKQADIFVVLDTVQFPMGRSWVNRNRIKTPSGQLWLSVPVRKKGLGLQLIQDVEIDNSQNWSKKHLLSMKHFYKKAPYFYDYIDYFNQVYKMEWKKILDLNLELLKQIAKWLKIETKIVRSSELFVGCRETACRVLRGSELLSQICKLLGADTYISGSGGKKYIEERFFRRHGIEVKYYSFNPSAYPQLWGDFIVNLSIVDLLFNCGKKGFDRIFLTKE